MSGLQFTVGTHPVTYTVTDRAGLQSSCTFNVQVKQLTGQLQLGRFALLFKLFEQDKKVSIQQTDRASAVLCYVNAQLCS